MSMNRKPPVDYGPAQADRPIRWFEQAKSHQLAPRDETTSASSGAPVPELAQVQAVNFARNGVAFIDLDRARISEPSGRATLRLAALRLGLPPDSVVIAFDAGTNTLRMTRR
jgi:hypothetical protein